MNRRILSALILTGVALSGCGKVGPLEPRSGSAAPAKAYGAEAVAGADDLMTPAVQTRPGRSDELMRRSERREEDPFDLPPGGPKPKEPAKKPGEPQSTELQSPDQPKI